MIKKLLLTFSMITLLTIAFSGTTYTTQAEEKAVKGQSPSSGTARGPNIQR